PGGEASSAARDQGQGGDLPRYAAARLPPLRDNDIDAGHRRPFGLHHGTDLVEDFHAGGMSWPHVRRGVAPEERENGDVLLETDSHLVLDREMQDQVHTERLVR